MEFHEVHWKQTIPIRNEVLWPNKPEVFCHVEGDDSALHYGAYVTGKLVSVASVYMSNDGARLRKFATIGEYQCKGIGSALLSHILVQLENKGAVYFWCDARETALKFYEKFGLHSKGERFYKSEIPYFKMCKTLK